MNSKDLRVFIIEQKAEMAKQTRLPEDYLLGKEFVLSRLEKKLEGADAGG